MVENAFRILANRFRVFHTRINLSPDKMTQMILATCCLHNFLVESNNSYTSLCDAEDMENHTATNGAWRNDPLATVLPPLLEDKCLMNSTTGAILYFLTFYFVLFLSTI